ncbi:hypothetical protein A2533_03995 [Candidatus Falkowbacteria bacterium RIFOXYD2_FULL_35_9]|uniref:DUF3592 domain-containing protein n=1 Tax=Candidatus Falkowbacteria bacterium RIFOXYC2_FULL_36_12 TaxID=1798002 RepID=A0A1F5SW07_9BACT|nr:MAG: hypothetical protein A2478_00520 [Candidatus Falkowbacteria bacterium RIFOXYC2_FULL_36_12]OGF32990.1 MAG: hypothetical protein A2223_02020 [Candidatus Falkowbacteria bacterium RIFOXYA2_FULL_35_8]OGF48153.1 MAG: hypothetical protein A2533_03995 [Candidatus Falkowbacteria bacterium RIFOXYD2_FULL_35_9]
MDKIGYLISFLLGLVMFFAGLLYGIKVLKIKKWPRTEAKVLNKEVVFSKHPAARAGSLKSVYEVAVEFEYSVDGKQYKGEKLFPSNHLLTENKAQKLLKKIPEQAQIFYNRNKPEIAYFYAEHIAIPIEIIIAGLFLLIIGLAYFN